MEPIFDYDELKYETDAAWLLDIDGEELWFPKSKCDIDDDQTIAVPEWSAKEKGLI